MSESYQLTHEDRDILEAAQLLLQKMAEPGVVPPAQLVTVAKLEQVLWRLPDVCTSVNACVSIATRIEHADIRTLSYWEFSAYEGQLRLSTGGSEHDPAIGSDSYSKMEWSITPSGPSEYNGVWDELWMVPELQYYPERKLNIDLRSDDYTIQVSDEHNSLLCDQFGLLEDTTEETND